MDTHTDALPDEGRRYAAADIEMVLHLLDPDKQHLGETSLGIDLEDRNALPIPTRLSLGRAQRATLIARNAAARHRQIDTMLNPDRRPGGSRSRLVEIVLIVGTDAEGNEVDTDNAVSVRDAIVKVVAHGGHEMWRIVADGRLVSEATHTREGALLVMLEAKQTAGRVHGAYSYAAKVLDYDTDRL